MLCNFKEAGIPGVTDGMAIDDEDKLWVTAFDGHQVCDTFKNFELFNFENIQGGPRVSSPGLPQNSFLRFPRKILIFRKNCSTRKCSVSNL